MTLRIRRRLTLSFVPKATYSSVPLGGIGPPLGAGGVLRNSAKGSSGTFPPEAVFGHVPLHGIHAMPHLVHSGDFLCQGAFSLRRHPDRRKRTFVFDQFDLRLRSLPGNRILCLLLNV